MKWDLIIIFLAIYNCVMIPMNVAFTNTQEFTNSLEFMLLERCIDLLFGIDIFLNFRTTFVNQKTNIEIVDPMRIAKNYINSVRFPFDILASVPFDILIQNMREKSTENDSDADSDNIELKLLGILKLIRLFRLGRIITYMKVNASLKIGFRIF
jgi:hypothetical protein